MAYQQTEDKVKAKQERTKRAIAMAMQNRWPEAVAMNQVIDRGLPRRLGVVQPHG